MNFEQFVIPGIEEEFDCSQSYHSHETKIIPESTCFESSVQQDPSSSDEEHTHNLKKPHVTRLIRKRYDPIVEGSKTIRYEDDPVEYKKARKKIQNRISANKVRGKKRNEMGDLEDELKVLMEKNSELTLQNSKLEGENSILRERVAFLEKMVMKQKEDQIGSYISTDTNSKEGSPPFDDNSHEDYDSPFESSSWTRLPSFGLGKSSTYLLVMTIILGVVMYPSSEPSQSAIIATKISSGMSLPPDLTSMFNGLYQSAVTLERLKYWGKVLLMVVYVCALCLLVYKKRNVFLRRKKTI